MAHPFEFTHEIKVDASPEEVWEAIATGPGVDAWFMGRNEIEPREGGKTRMVMTGMSGRGDGDGLGAADAVREPHVAR